MRVIIIGAGRGGRLMPTTADTPKCFAEVEGRRILDWSLEAFRSNGVNAICFIGGYCIEKVHHDYPEFDFRHNTRGLADMQRATVAAKGIRGKRLTYRRTDADMLSAASFLTTRFWRGF